MGIPGYKTLNVRVPARLLGQVHKAKANRHLSLDAYVEEALEEKLVHDTRPANDDATDDGSKGAA